MEILFFDMDNVLVDFKSGLDRVAPEIKAQYDDDGTGKPHYDDIPGLFSLMDPMPGAIEAVKAGVRAAEIVFGASAANGREISITVEIEFYFALAPPSV